MMRKKSFSLLEILVGISLVAFVSSAVVWKMSRLIQKKRFEANVERIQSRILAFDSRKRVRDRAFRGELATPNRLPEIDGRCGARVHGLEHLRHAEQTGVRACIGCDRQRVLPVE